MNQKQSIQWEHPYPPAPKRADVISPAKEMVASGFSEVHRALYLLSMVFKRTTPSMERTLYQHARAVMKRLSRPINQEELVKGILLH